MSNIVYIHLLKSLIWT